MLFTITVFLSAFLLFQVQLLVAKQLLPWFGGTPMVWTICQMFFQIVLLGGYIYGHALTGHGRPWRQYRVHLGVLLAAGAGLVAVSVWSGAPLLAAASMKPSTGGHPGLQLFTLLVITAGLPAFAVSTTGPLLQRWHARTMTPLAGTYRLYAVSNAGSLLGLLSYPIAVERLLTLTQQAWMWAAVFVVFATGATVIARRSASQPDSIADPDPVIESHDPSQQRPGAASVAMWLVLSLVGSVILLATTNHLSQDVAAVPFLWVLPLTIYLITFIVCFEHPRWYSRRWTLGAGLPVTILVGTASDISLPIQLVANALFVFCFCMLCHGELVRRRPGAAHLTTFYVVMALGGALGGVLVGVAAPALLPDVWEFHVAIVLGWVVVAVAWWSDRDSPFFVGESSAFALCLAVSLFMAARYAIERTGIGRIEWIVASPWTTTYAAVVLPVLGASFLVRRSEFVRASYWPRALLALGVGLSVYLLLVRVSKDRDDTVYTARNFYGVVRVAVTTRDGIEARQLIHGTTLHGVQIDTLAGRNMPTVYYSRSSGIAAASNDMVRSARSDVVGPDPGVHFGVVGMGIGTMSAFARAGDRVRYYEINPEVVALARGPEAYFTFIKDSPAVVTVVPGDARLSLERELAAAEQQKFDLLSIDAFSGDSVPVHLITREAFRTYAAHLRSEKSILAVNVTNRYLDLEPVVAANALDLGLSGVRVDTPGDLPVRVRSSWILLSRHPFDFRNVRPSITGRPLRTERVLFTDRFSNLLQVLTRNFN